MAVTGSDEKPPGKVAENWGRRDHIRAGSVSGPWRSTPRDDTGELPVPPASARRPPASTPGKPLPLDWMGRGERAKVARPGATTSNEDAMPEAARGRAPDPTKPATSLSYRGPSTDRLNTEDPTSEFDRRSDPQAPAANQRPTPIVPMPRSTMVPVIAAASLVAVAIVIAATLLRPDAPVSRSAALPDPTASVTEAVDLPTMRLRLGPGFPPERQSEIMTLLVGAGHDDVLVERIPFSIAVSRVGYYRPEDRAAAADLARLVSTVLDEPTGTIAVRDYAELIPDAVPGRLDLWIGDQQER